MPTDVGRRVQGAAKFGVDTVRSFVDALRGTGTDLVEVVGELATVTAGTATSTVRAALKGSVEIGGGIVDVVAGTAQAAIDAARSLALDLEDKAAGVGQGVIDGAKEVGLNVEDAATDRKSV